MAEYRVHNIIRAAIICYIMVFLLFFISCRTKTIVYLPEKILSGSLIYDELIENVNNIESYAAGRINMNIDDDGTVQNIRGTIRLKFDSVILISINAFAGFEAARIVLTRDSLKMLDRVNNRYFIGDYKESLTVLPYRLDYQLVQSLILGTADYFRSELSFLNNDETEYYFENGLISLRIERPVERGINSYDDNVFQLSIDELYRIRNVEFFSRDRNIFVSVKYNSFHNMDGVYLPEDIDIRYTSHNIPLIANLRIGRIEVNRNLSFPFTVPSSYQQILK